MSRKRDRIEKHLNKSNRHIAPGDLKGQVPTVEDGILRLSPSVPFANKPAEPVEDFDVQRLLEMRHGTKTGKYKNIGMDEKVDLKEMTEKNGGKPPRFLAMKKATIENFQAKLQAAVASDRIPRFDDITERLAATLRANGSEVAMTQTNESAWLLEPGPDGKVSIPVERNTRRRLDALRRPGESDEDVINRVMSTKREPTYPVGTPEYDVAMELIPYLQGAGLTEYKSKAIHTKLQRMPVNSRYDFLRDQLLNTLGPNDDTDAWAGNLGVLMAFVTKTLPSDMARDLANEVVEKLAPGKTADQEFPAAEDAVARASARKIEKALENLSPDRAAAVVRSVFEGNFQIDKGESAFDVMPGFTDRVTRHIAASGKGRKAIQDLIDSDNAQLRFTPEQIAKLRLYLDTGDTGPAHTVLDEKRGSLEKSRREIDKRKAEIAACERHDQALKDIEAIAAAPRLTRLGETGYHKALQTWKDGTIILPQNDHLTLEDKHALSSTPTIFVVQHDWSSAFDKATDFSEGEFILPYGDVVFEFRISGRRVCCCIQSDDTLLTAVALLIETSVGWALGAIYSIQAGIWAPVMDGVDLCAPIMNLCRNQVRAVCIALEAQVVETEVIRAPHRLNRQRERKGKLPIFDHHIVHLANRKHYLPREALPGDLDEEHPGKRLHFVRGHWRHYTNAKTWIKWHLRGNPDLGFVDKEYRL